MKTESKRYCTANRDYQDICWLDIGRPDLCWIDNQPQKKEDCEYWEEKEDSMSTINKEVKKEIKRLKTASDKRKKHGVREAMISLVTDALKKDDTATLVNILPSLRRM